MDQPREEVKAQGSEIEWVGEPWICDNHLKHYKAFCRDGIQISVKSFVLVMSVESYHYIAYVKDFYENIEGSKVVTVQWFHRHVEVMNACPELDAEEIILSPSVESIDAECIDSLAAVLCPHDFNKCLELFKDDMSTYGIYMCCKQLVNNTINHVSINELPGYKDQPIFLLLDNHGDGLSMGTEDLACKNPRLQVTKKSRSVRLHKKPKIVDSDYVNSSVEEQRVNSGVSISISEKQMRYKVRLPPKLKYRMSMDSVGFGPVASGDSNSHVKEQTVDYGVPISIPEKKQILLNVPMPPKLRYKMLRSVGVKDVGSEPPQA